MRKALTILAVLAVATTMSIVPAVAGGANTPVGDQINVLSGTPTTFDAGEPFHVMHGFLVEPKAGHPVGKYDFRLDIDGIAQGKGKLVNEADGQGGFIIRTWLYNYPDGLPEGTYVFTGHWFEPCSYAVEIGDYPGPCPKPNASVEVFTASLTVVFS